jgi:oligopeptide transport system permease protein
VGLVVQAVILLIGVPAGLAAAYFGGKIDTAIMRTVDALYSIPSLLFVIVIMTFLRATLATAESGFTRTLASLDTQSGGLIGIFIGLGLINWMPTVRLVRGQAASLKEKEFVEAARGIGATDRRIMAQHLLPNVIPIIVVTATIGIPQAIIYEAGISFLGLGARPPMPSWGLMIAEAIPNLRSYPYMLVSPAVALSLTVLAFNFLGDGLRDALDPWMER